MSATKTMTTQSRTKRDALVITTTARQSSPISSPATTSPSSPRSRWGQDRRSLTWDECFAGKVVYLPAKEDIAVESRIHTQTFGGRKWSHPAVITKVDKSNGCVEIMVATSNGNQGITTWKTGSSKFDVDCRRTHVLIAPKDDRNDDGVYTNPDQVMPSLVQTADSEDFRKTCYLRIAHTYKIEPENLVKYDRHIVLSAESMRLLANRPNVRAPKRSFDTRRASDNECERPAKQVALPKPLTLRSEEDLSWATVAKKATRSPSPPLNPWARPWVRGNAVAAA